MDYTSMDIAISTDTFHMGDRTMKVATLDRNQLTT